MTLRLFFHSDDLKANVEVLDCTPHENEFAVVLRATLFTRRAAVSLATPAGSVKAGCRAWYRNLSALCTSSTARCRWA